MSRGTPVSPTDSLSGAGLGLFAPGLALTPRVAWAEDGAGITRPVETSDTQEGRARNRREQVAQ